MPTPNGYQFHQAGQAVAAAHLGLIIRRISGNPAEIASDIVMPRGDVKSRMILSLAALAAESKCNGKSDPLRRMRNRQRMRSMMDEAMADLTGTHPKRLTEARRVRAQAQDRANAICTDLSAAIERVAEALARAGVLDGPEVMAIVLAVKAHGRKT